MENTFKKQQMPFTQVPNDLLYHPEISLKAKGLWSYMSAKPDGWYFSADRISKETKEDRKAILSALKELVKFGYLVAKKLSNGRMEYTLIWESAVSKPEKAPEMPKTTTTSTPPEKPLESPENGLTEQKSVGAENAQTGQPRKRPVRSDYKNDEEWVKAFYAWNEHT